MLIYQPERLLPCSSSPARTDPQTCGLSSSGSESVWWGRRRRTDTRPLIPPSCPDPETWTRTGRQARIRVAPRSTVNVRERFISSVCDIFWEDTLTLQTHESLWLFKKLLLLFSLEGKRKFKTQLKCHSVPVKKNINFSLFQLFVIFFIQDKQRSRALPCCWNIKEAVKHQYSLIVFDLRLYFTDPLILHSFSE